MSTTPDLKLFVAGMTPTAVAAARNAAALGMVEVIDVYDHPEQAEAHRILATPTLVKLSPPPPVRIVGDLQDLEAVRRALDLPRAPGPAGEAGDG